jgi:hypothetical protein
MVIFHCHVFQFQPTFLPLRKEVSIQDHHDVCVSLHLNFWTSWLKYIPKPSLSSLCRLQNQWNMAVVTLRTSFTDKCYKQVHKTFCGCKRLKCLHRCLRGPGKTMKSTSKYSWTKILSAYLMIICFLLYLMAVFQLHMLCTGWLSMMKDMEGSTNGLNNLF